MKFKYYLFQISKILLLAFIVNTAVNAEKTIKDKSQEATNDVVFNQDKWLNHKGGYYPFREEMVDSILHTNLIRDLNKKEIIELLGEPTYYRENKDYLYYLIDKTTFLGFWTLHTKTLVIKLKDNKVDWIKIHQ